MYQYVYTTKCPDIYPQEFLNYHLFELLVNNIDYLTKGKCKSINLDSILDLNISIPDIKLQKNIMEYINLNGSILIMLHQQISELKQLKHNLIESSIFNKKTKPLIEYCNIGHVSNAKNTIQINKNSNQSGQIGLTLNETDNSTNMFYLTMQEKTNKDMIYYLLKYHEPELMKISNSGNTIQLPKGKLENIEIPILTEEETNNLLKCKEIDEKIIKINNIYDQLLSESAIKIF
jgi:hypothetical protein